MSKPIQFYQDELGLALARELQRNQERSRRGKTPLQPSLNNSASATQAAAASDATTKANAAQTNANAYTDSKLAGGGMVPSGASILWDMSPPIPAGYSDTGYTINLAAGVNRKVIRKN